MTQYPNDSMQSDTEDVYEDSVCDLGDDRLTLLRTPMPEGDGFQPPPGVAVNRPLPQMYTQMPQPQAPSWNYFPSSWWPGQIPQAPVKAPLFAMTESTQVHIAQYPPEGRPTDRPRLTRDALNAPPAGRQGSPNVPPEARQGPNPQMAVQAPSNPPRSTRYTTNPTPEVQTFEVTPLRDPRSLPNINPGTQSLQRGNLTDGVYSRTTGAVNTGSVASAVATPHKTPEPVAASTGIRPQPVPVRTQTFYGTSPEVPDPRKVWYDATPDIPAYPSIVPPYSGREMNAEYARFQQEAAAYSRTGHANPNPNFSVEPTLQYPNPNFSVEPTLPYPNPAPNSFYHASGDQRRPVDDSWDQRHPGGDQRGQGEDQRLPREDSRDQRGPGEDQRLPGNDSRDQRGQGYDQRLPGNDSRDQRRPRDEQRLPRNDSRDQRRPGDDQRLPREDSRDRRTPSGDQRRLSVSSSRREDDEISVCSASRQQHSSRFASGSASFNQRSPRPKFNLKTFGKDIESYTIDEFISVMDDYVKPFAPDSDELRASIKSHVTGEASSVIIDADAKTWPEMKAALLLHYRPDGEDRTHMAALMAMKRKDKETPSSLAVRIRTSTRKAHPHLKLVDLDASMIQCFLRAMEDHELNRTVLSQDIRLFRKVVEVSTRLCLADGLLPKSTSSTKLSKPSMLNFQEQRQTSENDEATLAKIHKVVISGVEEALTDKGRGRSRDRVPMDGKQRGNSYGRREGSANKRDNSAGRGRSYNTNDGRPQRPPSANRDSRTPRPYSGNRDGARDRSRDRRPRDQSVPPRTSSSTRACFKCHGLGHFIVDCPSTHWYFKDGKIDVDRDNLEARKNPNSQGTSLRP